MGILDQVKQSGSSEAWLKSIFWGGPGVGKTTTALEADGPVLVLDTERGCQLYGSMYDFDVFSTRSYMEVWEFFKEFSKAKCTINGKRYKTIVIDSFSEVQKLLDDSILEQFKLKTGNNLYTFQPADYKIVNKAFKNLIDILLSLECNIIAICHEKQNFVQGQMMVLDQLNPLKPNVNDIAPHYFDVTLHFTKKGNKHAVSVTKSRIIDNNKRQVLPPKFENVDNTTFFQELMQYVTKNKKAPVIETNEPKNVASVDETQSLEDVKKQIYAKVTELKLSKTKLQEISLGVTGKASSNDFTLEEALAFLAHISGMEN